VSTGSERDYRLALEQYFKECHRMIANNMMENQKKKWEESYLNRDNFVFYPHEEVIRFVSKSIRKRIGLG